LQTSDGHSVIPIFRHGFTGFAGYRNLRWHSELDQDSQSKGHQRPGGRQEQEQTCGTDIMILDLIVEHDLNLSMQIISAEAARIIFGFHFTSMWYSQQSKRTAYQDVTSFWT